MRRDSRVQGSGIGGEVVGADPTTLTADLNASAFGSVPTGGSGMFALWEAALCGTDTTAIKNAQAQVAAFNTQGDSASFTPGTSADSKNARATADAAFWNIIRP